jgi:hypothetical protein
LVRLEQMHGISHHHHHHVEHHPPTRKKEDEYESMTCMGGGF